MFDASLGAVTMVKHFSTTQPRTDIMEFLDNKKNWGEKEVKHGRAWTKDELRIKSSSDLHQIWYVLLKEQNMLMTMEHEYKRLGKYFPSPERIDKVQISMENLEDVVKERNRAYYELELGENRVREPHKIQNQVGMYVDYRPQEHFIPKEENKEWHKERECGGAAISKFLKKYKEKMYNEKRKKKNRDRNHVIGLLKRFPNIEIDLLKEKYPDVDIDKLLREDKIRPFA